MAEAAQKAESCHQELIKRLDKSELRLVLRIIDESVAFFMARQPNKNASDSIILQEEEIDDLVVELRYHHVERLNRLECTPDIGMIFIDILTDLERVSDHATNIMYAGFDADGA